MARRRSAAAYLEVPPRFLLLVERGARALDTRAEQLVLVQKLLVGVLVRPGGGEAAIEGQVFVENVGRVDVAVLLAVEQVCDDGLLLHGREDARDLLGVGRVDTRDGLFDGLVRHDVLGRLDVAALQVDRRHGLGHELHAARDDLLVLLPNVVHARTGGGKWRAGHARREPQAGN